MSRVRYLYRPGHPHANERGFVDSAREHELIDLPVGHFTDCYMNGDRAPDGTDIGSRSKRRGWMKATGVADLSDFTETTAHAAKVREDFYTTGGDHKERREAVGRAYYNSRMGRKPERNHG